MFEKILVPLDGTILADKILPLLRDVLAEPCAEVVLLRVLSDDGSEEPAPKAVLENACEHLAGVSSALREAGFGTRFEVFDRGEPTARILDVARTEKVSLIALATHGRSGVSRWLRGSVAETVLRAAEVPVLTANPSGLDERRPRGRLRRILLPVDASQASFAILPLVRELVRRHGAEVVLLQVVPLEDLGHGFGLGVYRDVTSEALEVLCTGDLSGFEARAKVVQGFPVTSIVDVIAQEEIDLVAMTTHGRTGLARLVFGSVAEGVLRQAPCPVIVHRLVADALAGATRGGDLSVRMS